MGRLFHPVSINTLHIPGNLFLAPLAGYTDKAFRTMCVHHGASFTFSEMVSAEGIIRENRKTLELMEPAEAETLFGVQLFTGNPDTAARCAAAFSRFKVSLIDLNCGCPVPKVTKAGAGAGLLKDPEKLGRIIRSLTEHTDLPVTVKIRSGWDSSSINYLETAGAARENGASMVCLHARTRAQGYSGTPFYEHIAHLKMHMDIPVIGSGDLFTPDAVKQMMESTGCDGVMIARGAMGNPFIFQQCRSLLLKGSQPGQPNRDDKIKAAMEHLSLCEGYYGPARTVKEMKKHLCAYTKGITGGANLRNRLVHAVSCEELGSILASALTEQGEGDISSL